MVDKKKETSAADTAETRSGDPLFDMVRAVGDNGLTLPQAVSILRKHVLSLSEEDREEWKKNAVSRARRLMSIAEAFSQELTVIGAGQ